MSAIKTHDLYDVIHGDQIVFENEDGQQTLEVKTMLVDRQKPKTCQLFTAAENVGSMSSNTSQVYHAFIKDVRPSKKNPLIQQFSVDAQIGDETRELNLQTLKSKNRDCVIS